MLKINPYLGRKPPQNNFLIFTNKRFKDFDKFVFEVSRSSVSSQLKAVNILKKGLEVLGLSLKDENY